MSTINPALPQLTFAEQTKQERDALVQTSVETFGRAVNHMVDNHVRKDGDTMSKEDAGTVFTVMIEMALDMLVHVYGLRAGLALLNTVVQAKLPPDVPQPANDASVQQAP